MEYCLRRFDPNVHKVLHMSQIFRLGLVFAQLGFGLFSVETTICRKLHLKDLLMASKGDSESHHFVKSIKDWQFSKLKLLDLPLDKNKENFLRRNNQGCLFSFVTPSPLLSPYVVAYSRDALTNILNMDPEIVEDPEFADFMAGNIILNNSEPIAHRYGGHQFGYWATQLGDGRAILLGEFVNRLVFLILFHGFSHKNCHDA